MINPYRPGNPEHQQIQPHAQPPCWWWLPMAAPLLAVPGVILLKTSFRSSGHGQGFAEKVLFPLDWPLRILLGHGFQAEGLFCLQYLLYGLILSAAAYCHRLLIAALTLLAFHAACYLGSDLVTEFLIHGIV